MDSQWQLKSLTFPRVECTASGEFETNSSTDLSVKIEADGFTADASIFFVNAKIGFGEDTKSAQYKIDVHAFGVFQYVANALDLEKASIAEIKENLDRFLGFRANAIQLLYGACREFVQTVTARGPWGSIILPIRMTEGKECTLGIGDDLAMKIGQKPKKKRAP